MRLLLRYLLLSFVLLWLMASAPAQSPPKEPDEPAPSAAVKALLDRSAAAAQANKWTDALASADEALAAAKQAMDLPGIAGAERGRAQALEGLGRTDEAVAAWRKAASAWHEAGDGPGQVEALLNESTLLIMAKTAEAEPLIAESLRVANEETKRPLAAAIAIGRGGGAFYHRGRPDVAERLWKVTLERAQAISADSLEVAASLHYLGVAAQARGDLVAAADYFKRSVIIREKLSPNSLDVAASLHYLGFVEQARANLTQAADYFKRSLVICEKLAPDSPYVASGLNDLGVVAFDRGDLDAAEDYYKRSLAVYEKLAPNSLDIASGLNNLGNVALSRANLKLATDYYRRSLAIKEKLAPNSLTTALTLRNLGTVAWGCGDLSAAADYYKRSLTMSEKLAPNSLEVAGSLNNLGLLAYNRGDLTAATYYYKRSLVLFENLAPNSREVAASLNGLGAVANARGDLAAAEDYLKRSLIIFRHLATNSLDVGVILHGLGDVAKERGNHKVAIDYYRRSQTIFEKMASNSPYMAASLTSLGYLAWDRGDLTAAAGYHKRSLNIRQNLAPNSLDVAESLSDLGAIAERQHHLSAADTYAHHAWDIVRHQARQIQGDQARLAFSTENHRYAATLLRLQTAHHHLQAAFLTLEQSRAQALLQLLYERRLLTTTSTGPAFDRYQEAQARHGRALQPLDQTPIAIEHTKQALQQARKQAQIDEIATLQQQLTQLTQQLQQAPAEEIRTRLEMEARYTDLTQASANLIGDTALPFEKTRASLPEDALFLAFSVDDKQTTLLLCHRTGPLQTFTLPLTQKYLRQMVVHFRALLTNRDSAESNCRSAGHALFASLFPPPVQAAIQKAARLVISPDDALWECPFAALVPTNLSAATPTWLGLQKPICLTPSLTLYAQSRTAPLKQQVAAEPVALVVGDCVFKRPTTSLTRSPQPSATTTNSSGAPIATRGTSAPVPAPEVSQTDNERSYLYENGKPPAPLPHTAEEARQIAALYHTQPLLGQDATEAAVRRRLPQADVIHLATHGILSPRVALASGVLLSLPEPTGIGEADNPDDDGDLQAWEWAALNLHADLAVLSACETGLGKTMTGEGVQGLTRALAGAGCRSVVTSLWSVSDASTSELMLAFHKALRRGVSKDEALREAMVKVARTAGREHPGQWAAFFLMGDPQNHLASGH